MTLPVMLAHQKPQTVTVHPSIRPQRDTNPVHKDIPPVCSMLLETAQKGRQAVSGLLAHDAWGGLEGQAMQAWAAWETPQPPRSCYHRCIQPLSRLRLEAKCSWVHLVA